MELIGLLIAVPVVVALILLAVRNDAARAGITIVGALTIGIGSIVLAVQYLGQGSVQFDFESNAVDIACFVIDLALSVVVIGYGIRYKRALAIVLVCVQIALTLWFELGAAHGVTVAHGLYVDGLSILMALIIGIIGSGICVYALGYMTDFQKHEPEGARDRRPFFFFLLFLFLGAMFLIVFANNMAWMLTGWEITTVCSFLLIGYTKTDEAIANSFRQIIMNMLGGIAFSVALIFSASQLHTLALNEFLLIGMFVPAAAVVPVTCLAFAGLTKAAQMPFHTWLLGAMVAPTPTSALLHSSTMVKAGVFMLVKLAPALSVNPLPGYMVILVGGITFLLCSCMAISQTNAKRVLAYSTITNLGLISACAGVGSSEAVWAACFLILFHAAAKSLLFLCVGTAEHHIGSRDIEDMDNLFVRMPRLAKCMMLGIMCMFVAPYGMLISKWAALVAFISTQHFVMLVLLVFGSAVTFMFWAKWLGKLSGIAGNAESVETDVHSTEWASIGLMAALAVLCCVGMPLVSDVLVIPYLQGIWTTVSPTLAADNLWIMSVIAIFVLIVLLGAHAHGGSKRQAPVYMAGVAVDDAERTFRNSLSGVSVATARNWYVEELFGEKRLRRVGEVVCACIMAIAFMAPIANIFMGM